MSFLFYLVLIIALALVILWFRRRHLFTDIRDEFAAAWDDAKAEVHAHRAAADTGEPIGDEEAGEIIDWYRRQARPALILRPDPTADTSTAAARLGGDVWFADGEKWPVGADGAKLEFVAQYDLARLPPLDGFPSQGVARFFVGRNDIWGGDFDAPDRSNVRVLWHDGPQSGGRLEPPLPWGEDENSPFESVSARADGVALRPEPVDDLPDFDSWQLQERLEREAGRPGLDAVENALFDVCETRGFAHRIGGHPSFTQPDFRRPGVHDDLDVLLLGLSSDETIMWGDVGEAGFYIRRADFDRRDFTRVGFYWDCH